MQKPAVLRKIWIHLVAATVLAAVFVASGFSWVICPVRAVFKIPCPTCGMTRSVTSLFRLDFALSFKQNPLTIPFFVLLLFAIHKDLFGLGSKTKNIIISIGAILVFAVYLIRLFTGQV